MTSTSTLTSRALYGRLMREAKGFTDYNFRSYAIRRIQSSFRDPSPPSNALEQGHKALAMLRRQVAISKMYPPPQPHILEL